MPALKIPNAPKATGGGGKPPIPKGSYQGELQYIYFDKGTHMNSSRNYQELQFAWDIYIANPETMPAEVQEHIKNNFYRHIERFIELDFKVSWTNTEGRTFKASAMVRRFEALNNAPFTDEDTVDWSGTDDKFTELGDYPLYRELTVAETEEFQAAHGGRQPTGDEKYKDTGDVQTLYKGVMRQCHFNGEYPIIGNWASIKFDINPKGYNRTGADAVSALSNIEREYLKDVIAAPNGSNPQAAAQPEAQPVPPPESAPE